MTLELWNTFATIGTFIVIAATAIAALVQLRHTRGSNQIAALDELQAESQTPQFEAAGHIMRTELAIKLADPEFRYQLCHLESRTPENRLLMSSINAIGNFYEHVGLLTKLGLLDRDLALDFWATEVPGAWNSLAQFTAIVRREQGDDVWENFEYLAVLSREWRAKHPKGAYPRGVPRIGLKDEWLEADGQYEASRPRA